MHLRPTLPLAVIALLGSGTITFSSCAKKKHIPAVAAGTPANGVRHPAKPTTAPDIAQIPSTEIGLASWYGHPYHGRAAANGEIYDMEKLTAAHRTLPFGTWVRVTNLFTGKSVDVRIIDRGPFIEGRVIDLSHAAAQAVDLIGPGVAQVRIDLIAPPPIQANATILYAVQVGAFQDRDRAERYRTTLASQYGTAHIVFRDGKPALWRVLVGAERSVDAANLLAQRLQAEVGSGFIVRLDQAPEPVQAGTR